MGRALVVFGSSDPAGGNATTASRLCRILDSLGYTSSVLNVEEAPPTPLVSTPLLGSRKRAVSSICNFLEAAEGDGAASAAESPFALCGAVAPAAVDAPAGPNLLVGIHAFRAGWPICEAFQSLPAFRRRTPFILVLGGTDVNEDVSVAASASNPRFRERLEAMWSAMRVASAVVAFTPAMAARYSAFCYQMASATSSLRAPLGGAHTIRLESDIVALGAPASLNYGPLMHIPPLEGSGDAPPSSHSPRADATTPPSSESSSLGPLEAPSALPAALAAGFESAVQLTVRPTATAYVIAQSTSAAGARLSPPSSKLPSELAPTGVPRSAPSDVAAAGRDDSAVAVSPSAAPEGSGAASVPDISMREALRLPPHSIVLLNPCGLRPVKDPLFVADAVAAWNLQSASRPVVLAIVGPALDDDCVDSVRRAAAAAASVSAASSPPSALLLLAPSSSSSSPPAAWPAIVYHDAIPQARLWAWMREADVVLNTSVSEGQSSALIEAMALGCPVVARQNEGNASVVVHGISGQLFATPEEAVCMAKNVVEGRAAEWTSFGARHAQASFSFDTERAAWGDMLRGIKAGPL